MDEPVANYAHRTIKVVLFMPVHHLRLRLRKTKVILYDISVVPELPSRWRQVVYKKVRRKWSQWHRDYHRRHRNEKGQKDPRCIQRCKCNDRRRNLTRFWEWYLGYVTTNLAWTLTASTRGACVNQDNVQVQSNPELDIKIRMVLSARLVGD